MNGSRLEVRRDPGAAVNLVVARHYRSELARAEELELDRDWTSAWHALERAHILSQAHAVPHVQVHLRMLGFAWRRRAWREVFGQLPRILLAVPGSLLGRAPRGNTGGSDVGIFTPMPIPTDLQRILDGEDDERSN